MLITGQPTRARKSAREDLHVAREHHEVDVARECLERARLGLWLGLGRDRDVHKRHAERFDFGADMLVV